MTDFRTKLTHRFRKQQEFATGYSPLYERLFGLVGDWLAVDDGDPLVEWLLGVSNGRSSLDITLLLMAGLHRDILNHEAETTELAQYYPAVGGTRLPADPELGSILRQTIIARRDQLTLFIQSAAVQTNETGRGVAWLLPLLYTGWEAVHLIDLGASAGLNLMAEARNYRLVFSDQLAVNSEQFIDIGRGNPVQFLMQSQGHFHQPPATNHLPRILSRTASDFSPFELTTPAAEQTLAAFIWGDQPSRLERLREGITAFHQANRGPAPIQFQTTRLPEELPELLETFALQQSNHPVLIYNTIVTFYLNDNGRSLHQHIANWAKTENRPVLWLQWEPLWDGPEPPVFGWIAWTADLWQANKHHHWHLAWIHPHGTPLHWQPGLSDWAAFWPEKR